VTFYGGDCLLRLLRETKSLISSFDVLLSLTSSLYRLRPPFIENRIWSFRQTSAAGRS
jgi:hypothetical protein